MQALTDRVVSVATLNLWNLADPWPARLAVIRAELARLRPDVLLLQECVRVADFDVDQARDVTEGLGHPHVLQANVPGGPYPFGNAITSRFPLDDTAVVTLPREGTDDGRCLLLARARTPWGPLPIACTHLNWKLDEGHVRVAQTRFVVERLTAFTRDDDLPALLGGDFNAEPDSDEVRYLRGRTGLGGPCVYFNDCFAAAGDGSPGHTFCGRNPYGAASREPDRRIDYVFVRGPNDRLQGVPLEARVCFDEPTDDVWASDHYGVFTRIEL
jgi:endonuclease/exonuclease/phosphatase family metal-dependent hydrolase